MTKSRKSRQKRMDVSHYPGLSGEQQAMRSLFIY
jgi:hypothetical protein